MKNKISNKLYGALLRCGTPPEIAAQLARATDFLGESTDETVERDNYEIMITAKALSSLISRHPQPEFTKETLDKTVNVSLPISSESESNNDRLTKVSPMPKATSAADNYPADRKPKKESKFWSHLETMPHWSRVALSVILPTLMYLGMVLLTVIVIGLTGACILSMVGMTVAGIILFIIGLLYGVSQLSIFPAAAYYEIGLGLILAGISSLLIVLLYNALTRLLPYSLKIGIKKLHNVTRSFRRFRANMREKTAS